MIALLVLVSVKEILYNIKIKFFKYEVYCISEISSPVFSLLQISLLKIVRLLLKKDYVVSKHHDRRTMLQQVHRYTVKSTDLILLF